MTLSIIITILIAHFVADWLLQTSWMAQNKWNQWRALSAHVAVYTLIMVIAGFNLGIESSMIAGVAWGLLNGALHYWIDYITSKITHTYWDRKDFRAFFLAIGADQLIHYLILFWTYSIFFS